MQVTTKKKMFDVCDGKIQGGFAVGFVTREFPLLQGALLLFRLFQFSGGNSHSLDLFHCFLFFFPSDHDFEAGVIFAGNRISSLCHFNIFTDVQKLFLCCDQFQ